MSKQKSVQIRKERNKKIEKLLVLIVLFAFGFVMSGKAYMYHRAYHCIMNDRKRVYVGHCKSFEVKRTKLPRGVRITYYFYLDNGVVLSAPQFILERAEIDASKLNMIFADCLEFSYCPYSTLRGTHWIVSVSKGDQMILSESITQVEFARSTKFYGALAGLSLCPAIFIVVVPKIFILHRWIKKRRKAKLRKKRKQLRDNQRPT